MVGVESLQVTAFEAPQDQPVGTDWQQDVRHAGYLFEPTTAAVASAIARSSSVGTTRTGIAEDGVEITRGSFDRPAFRPASSSIPKAPSRSATSARNWEEFSPIPAVNTSALAPPTATW